MQMRHSNSSALRNTRSVSRRDLLTGITLTLLAVSCAPATPTAAPAPTAPAKPADKAAPAAKPAGARPAKITVAYPGSIAFNHVASYMGWEAIKATGYQVETKQYSNINLAVNGVVANESQIGWIAAGGAMNAIKQGNKLKAFFHGQRNVFFMISKKSVSSFKDLDGRTIADTVPGQQNDAIRAALEKKYGIHAQVVRFNESGQRTQALLAGQADVAGGMQPEDFVEIEAKRPGEFKILVRYSDEFPTVGGTFLWVRDDFVEQYPDAMMDITEALIRTYRRAYDDASGFLTDVKKFLPNMSDDVLKASLKAYTEPKYWDPNGGMGEEIAKGTGDFYGEAGLVKDPPAPAEWMNWKLVDAVLGKVGRR